MFARKKENMPPPPLPKKNKKNLSHFNIASTFFLVFRFRNIFLNKLNES